MACNVLGQRVLAGTLFTLPHRLASLCVLVDVCDDSSFLPPLTISRTQMLFVEPLNADILELVIVKKIPARIGIVNLYAEMLPLTTYAYHKFIFHRTPFCGGLSTWLVAYVNQRPGQLLLFARSTAATTWHPTRLICTDTVASATRANGSIGLLCDTACICCGL